MERPPERDDAPGAAPARSDAQQTQRLPTVAQHATPGTRTVPQRAVAQHGSRAIVRAVGVRIEPPAPPRPQPAVAPPRRWPGRRERAAAGGCLSFLLLLPLLLLLDHHHHHHAHRLPPGTRPIPARHVAAPLAGVGMPVPAGGTVLVRPIEVVVALGPRIDATARRRELQALGAWMAANHRHASRVTVVEDGRATRPLSAAGLSAHPHLRAPRSLGGVLRRALRHRRGFRYLVVRMRDAPPMPVPPGVATLTIDGTPGAAIPRQLGLAPGGAATVSADLRRPRALAALVARAVMAVSQQQER